MVHMWVNTVTGCGLPREEINGLRFGPLLDDDDVVDGIGEYCMGYKNGSKSGSVGRYGEGCGRV